MLTYIYHFDVSKMLDQIFFVEDNYSGKEIRKWNQKTNLIFFKGSNAISSIILELTELKEHDTRLVGPVISNGPTQRGRLKIELTQIKAEIMGCFWAFLRGQ